MANSFTLMKESPDHELYTKASAEKPRKLLVFRMDFAKQLIGDYIETINILRICRTLKPVDIGLGQHQPRELAKIALDKNSTTLIQSDLALNCCDFTGQSSIKRTGFS